MTQDADEVWGWFYSRAEDEPYRMASSRDDAIEQGADEFDGEPFHIIEATKAKLSDQIFDACRVMEEFEERNEEAWGEDGPDATVDLDARTELEHVLNAAFAAWRAKHNPWTAWALGRTRNGEWITPVANLIESST